MRSTTSYGSTHPDGDGHRDPFERDALIAEAIAGPEWVIEGAQTHPWILPIARRGDLILVPETPRRRRF